MSVEYKEKFLELLASTLGDMNCNLHSAINAAEFIKDKDHWQDIIKNEIPAGKYANELIDKLIELKEFMINHEDHKPSNH